MGGDAGRHGAGAHRRGHAAPRRHGLSGGARLDRRGHAAPQLRGRAARDLVCGGAGEPDRRRGCERAHARRDRRDVQRRCRRPERAGLRPVVLRPRRASRRRHRFSHHRPARDRARARVSRYRRRNRGHLPARRSLDPGADAGAAGDRGAERPTAGRTAGGDRRAGRSLVERSSGRGVQRQPAAGLHARPFPAGLEHRPLEHQSAGRADGAVLQRTERRLRGAAAGAGRYGMDARRRRADAAQPAGNADRHASAATDPDTGDAAGDERNALRHELR